MGKVNPRESDFVVVLYYNNFTYKKAKGRKH